MLLNEDDSRLKKEMKKGTMLFETMMDSDSESEEEYDECNFDEVSRILDNQIQQAVSVFEIEMGKYPHPKMTKLKNELSNDFEFMSMPMEDENFLKIVKMGEQGVKELEEKLRKLEEKKRNMVQKKNYYQVKLNKLNRRRIDNANQFLLPAYKIVHQMDSVGGLRKYYSTPNLKVLDANLELLNQKQSTRRFISNILFVQEYIVDRGFMQTNLGNSIKKDKEYFFNKFEKTISSTIEYNFFTTKTNHFSIDYNKFKNKGCSSFHITINNHYSNPNS